MSVPRPLQQLRTGGPPLRRQFSRAGLAMGGGLVLVGGFVLLAALVDEPFKLFSKEPAESLGRKAYVGWLAHLGAVVWLAGAVCALFAGAVLLRSGRGRPARFLLAAGGYTLLLVLDDLFLLHEAFYPALGLRQEVIYLTYGGLLMVLTWHFPADVGRHGLLLLVLALAFWSGSVALDVAFSFVGGQQHLLEDGAKVIGIMLWTTFLAGAAATELLQALRQREPDRIVAGVVPAQARAVDLPGVTRAPGRR